VSSTPGRGGKIFLGKSMENIFFGSRGLGENLLESGCDCFFGGWDVAGTSKKQAIDRSSSG